MTPGPSESPDTGGRPVSLSLGGDVMLGRGMDQVMATSVDPALHEPSVRDARRYVELAEEESGPVPAPVAPAYPWGDALAALDRAAPDLRIVNLETSVTTADAPDPGKRIHYRTHPDNVTVLQAAGIDACVLANNHVLEAGDARVLLFARAATDAGVPRGWAAGPETPGVALLPDLSRGVARELAARIREHRSPGDVVVASLHWGGNWGYGVPARHRRFARVLVDEAGVDLVHGHSAHHAKGIGLHAGRPILYGCGDLLTDYEGIGGREAFRPGLSLLYFASLDPEGGPPGLTMRPFRLRRFRLRDASPEEAAWLRDTLDRESRALGARVEREEREPDAPPALRVRPAT